MSPGAVAAILYSRARLADRTFMLESEEAPDGGCYIVTASWCVTYGSDSRTFSAILALGIEDVVKLLRHSLASIGRGGGRS